MTLKLLPEAQKTCITTATETSVGPNPTTRTSVFTEKEKHLNRACKVNFKALTHVCTYTF